MRQAIVVEIEGLVPDDAMLHLYASCRGHELVRQEVARGCALSARSRFGAESGPREAGESIEVAPQRDWTTPRFGSGIQVRLDGGVRRIPGNVFDPSSAGCRPGVDLIQVP